MLPLMGQSGGGKSTLMMVLAALKWPLAGTLQWQLPDEAQTFGWNETGLLAPQAAYLRRCCFGFAFQRSTLTPDLRIRDNLIYPQLLMNQTQVATKTQQADQYEIALNQAKQVLASVAVEGKSFR